ncbi:Protein translocase subunit SecA [Geodia barretti]|uniref:Protein translocase subunit SecA n=1 Tax=Geodia barretti TaxID=519541 RepID=A0AA35XIB2_GEOBA|nr:Protein translocase subunit SecA [Geodia barretti]
MLRQEFGRVMSQFLPGRHADDWNAEGLIDDLGQICDLPPELSHEDQVYRYSREQVEGILSDHAESACVAREEEHLTAMENLRTGIGLHAYGQRNPLDMYRAEGQKMFFELQNRIQRDVVRTLFHVTVDPVQADAVTRNATRGRRNSVGDSPMKAGTAPTATPQPGGTGKVGRNASCPCGSGRKYKRCCGKAA